MNSSAALEYLKMGRRMTRRSYPIGQYVFAQKAYPEGIPLNRQTADATGIPEKTLCKFRPYFMVGNSKKEFWPWCPTHDDLLVNDWIEFEGGDDD